MKTNFTIIILLLFNYTVNSQNLTDSLGLKQGIWITSWYNGKYFYETYANDTLNGLYVRKNDGIIETKGYYKNGLKDSIWLEFDKKGNLDEKIFYKNGLKNGQYLSFRENSSLYSEKTYINDTLIKSYSYYPDYNILSYYSKPNFYVYYENGKLKIKSILLSNYMIDSIFNEQGDLTFPKNFQLEIVTNDTSIKNNSNLTITKLFSQIDRESVDFIYFPFLFVNGGEYFLKDTILSILFKEDLNSSICEVIQITPNSVKRTNLYTGDIGEKISIYNYQTLPVENRMSSNRKEVKVKLDFQLGKINIVRKPEGCDDAGRNPFTLKTKNGNIEFNDIDNLIIFELDLDKNDLNEIYVVSYISCMSYMKIYKIE